MLTRVTAALFLLLAAPATAADRQPQVVGGDPVQAGQFPFIVQIYTPTPGGTLGCTGSLIRDNWVLTAAHCAEGAAVPSQVLISDAYPMILGPSHTADLIAVAQWIPHPQFNPSTLANDVALIRLAQNASQHPPRFNGAALYTPSPIQLATSPSNTSISIGNVTIAGFGQTDDVSNPTFAYWAGAIPTFPTSVCNAEYSTTLNASQQLCFGTYPNICQGDSGGAVFKQTGQQFTQYGIVSFNQGSDRCGEVPSVATYVPGFVSWINQRINGTAPASPIQYGWELPPSSADGIASGISNAQGWAFSSAGTITSIRLERNGQHAATLPCCSERGDVRNAIPAAPLLSGFSAAINWGIYGNATNTLTLIVRDSAGNERRETRTVESVQVLNGVPFVRDLGFGQGSQCQFGYLPGTNRAMAECSHLSFQQGTCTGDITFAWQVGKQAFEVFEGCH